jgi:hypothetical protein
MAGIAGEALLRGKALEVSTKLGQCHFTTTDTDAVLREFLNALAEAGRHIRAAGIAMVEAIRHNPLVTVISQNRQLFRQKPGALQGSSRQGL